MTLRIPDYPWERLPQESIPAWEAFAYYRDMGPGRSIRKAADELSKSRSQLEGWSVRHDWVRRCRRWDDEADRMARERFVEERVEMLRRHAKTAEDQAFALAIPTRVLLDRYNRQPDVVLEELGAMPTNELVALIGRMSSTLPNVMNAERLARGESTERSESVTQNIEVGADDSPEQIARVAAILYESNVFGNALVTADAGVDDGADAEVHELHP